MVNIYKYLDYREYLRDLYDELKKTKSQFSFRYFSRQAGFRSPNYLKLVMDGERNLSQASIVKFANGFNLNKDQAEFFTNLVHYTQAKTLDEKNLYYEKMASSKHYLKVHKLEKEIYDYFSNWYNVVVREMVSMKGFRPNPTWIACHMRPNITVREAQQALDTLIELGLVEKKNKNLVKAKGNLTTDKEVESIAAANFQKAMIQKGSQSIDITPAKQRDISSLTVAVRKDRIPAVKEMVQNFRRQLHSLLQDDKDADHVYQINLQFFPLTEQVKKK